MNLIFSISIGLLSVQKIHYNYKEKKKICINKYKLYNFDLNRTLLLTYKKIN